MGGFPFQEALLAFFVGVGDAEHLVKDNDAKKYRILVRDVIQKSCPD